MTRSLAWTHLAAIERMFRYLTNRRESGRRTARHFDSIFKIWFASKATQIKTILTPDSNEFNSHFLTDLPNNVYWSYEYSCNASPRNRSSLMQRFNVRELEVRRF